MTRLHLATVFLLAVPLALPLLGQERDRSENREAGATESGDAPAEPDPAPNPLPQRARTTNQVLDGWVRKVGKQVQGVPGRWVFAADDVPMLVLTDEQHDRMRVMADIGPAEQLTKDDLLKMMQANFDRALDARYAVFQGRIWSVFIHPLGSVTEPQFLSAVRQVHGCVKNYGTTYSSGDMQFGGQADDEAPDKDEVF